MEWELVCIFKQLVIRFNNAACRLKLLLVGLSIFSSVVEPMIWNFNHGPWLWTSIQVLWKEFEVRAKVEFD